MKPVWFVGSSRDALRAFPPSARQRAGYQLERIQRGLEPDDWKPIRSVGPGARELRIRDPSGAFRVFYLVMHLGAVHVLHCFQKKGQKTSPNDIELGRQRYRELVRGGR
ncbi:MAG: type II toxin-antitoxin system RelE/ParE family toxin [Proteobacteria bacterium]|nr:type II toxin-antitoxin system RelE/ParE family toxin [Pseudomonadota bacterium]